MTTPPNGPSRGAAEPWLPNANNRTRNRSRPVASVPSAPAENPYTSHDLVLTDDAVDGKDIRARRRQIPQLGWQAVMYKVTGKLWNPGLGPKETELRELERRISQPIRGHRKVAVISAKGGIGKTTTTVVLGSVLASLRRDTVGAIDCNPDMGSLGIRVPISKPNDLRDLIHHLSQGDGTITNTMLQDYVNPNNHRLQSIRSSSQEDVHGNTEITDVEYRTVVRALQEVYPIMLSDTGTSFTNSIMTSILEEADVLVVVAANAVDQAMLASKTLDRLRKQGGKFADLSSNAISVINEDAVKGVDEAKIREYFTGRTAAVHNVPTDPHLAMGDLIDLDELGKETRLRYLRIAADLVDALVKVPPRR